MSEQDQADVVPEDVEVDETPPTPGADEGPQDDEATEPLGDSPDAAEPNVEDEGGEVG